jgi:hypothetical protein
METNTPYADTEKTTFLLYFFILKKIIEIKKKAKHSK